MIQATCFMLFTTRLALRL